MLEEVTFFARLFNICSRRKQWLFLVFKFSLCVSLVDMSWKHDRCSSSVSFWCLRVPLPSHYCVSVYVW